MPVTFKDVSQDVNCQAFNGILGECADLLEERMPFFNVWKGAWKVLSCTVVIEQGKVRYYGKCIAFQGMDWEDDAEQVVEHWESVYQTSDPIAKFVSEIFNKRILKVTIKERGFFDFATKEWGGK